MCIKVFNHLPQSLKDATHNPKQFRTFLKMFLYHHSFYSMDECFDYKKNVLENRYTIILLLLVYYTYQFQLLIQFHAAFINTHE
jgi:hypothetical protein